MQDFSPFWSDFTQFALRAAFIDAAAGRTVSYAELGQLTAVARARFELGSKGLIAMRIAPTINSIAIYLGALQAGHAVLLDNTIVPAVLNSFRPSVVVVDNGSSSSDDLSDYSDWGMLLGYRLKVSHTSTRTVIHPALALLIPTSGSTGVKRFIKLSYMNIHAGADQVAKGLTVTSDDRAITNLPLDYVYGLSILHSHLRVGASVVLESNSFVNPKFWDTFRENNVTGFGGVPFTYQTLRQLDFDLFELPSLATLTQAGGALSSSLRNWLTETFVPRGVGVYFMYGLSEATGRVTILSPASIGAHPLSVGVSVPFGRISIGENEEVLYEGPNVMLGYAEHCDDLRIGDTVGGVLRTGDLGSLSADGYLTIKGRLSRFGKVFGKRVALDELQEAYGRGSVLCMDTASDRLIVYHDGTDTGAIRTLIMELCQELRVPPQAVTAKKIVEIPRTPNGKIDYPRLATSTAS